MLSHGVWAELGFIGDAEFYDMDISAWITNGALGDRNVLFLTMVWWLGAGETIGFLGMRSGLALWWCAGFGVLSMILRSF